MTALTLAHPHTFRGHIGNPFDGPSGRDRVCDRAQSSTPLTRFVAPYGAPQKAPNGRDSMCDRALFGTHPTRRVAESTAPPNAPVAATACVAAHVLGHLSDAS
eukprot:3153109-Pyramimonas_sp.AAC.2